MPRRKDWVQVVSGDTIGELEEEINAAISAQVIDVHGHQQRTTYDHIVLKYQVVESADRDVPTGYFAMHYSATIHFIRNARPDKKPKPFPVTACDA